MTKKNLKHSIEVECQKFFSISISACTSTTPLLILWNRLRNPLKVSAIQNDRILSEVRKAVICTQLNLKLKKVT
jgi:hypothetical protein